MSVENTQVTVKLNARPYSTSTWPIMESSVRLSIVSVPSIALREYQNLLLEVS